MATKCNNSFGIVNKIPLLEKYCTPAQKLFLNNTANFCYYKKDTLIFKENFPAFGIFFIESGIVALSKECNFEKKQYMRFVKDGELFGYRGSILENSTYRLSAYAFENSKIYYVNQNEFNKVLNENNELHFNILLNYANELEKIETDFCNHITMNTREKVAEALLTIYKIFECKESKAINVSFCKAIPRKDIADIAGISVGKTINKIAEFRAEKILSTRGSKITILNLDKLNAVVSKFHITNKTAISFNNEYHKLKGADHNDELKIA